MHWYKSPTVFYWRYATRLKPKLVDIGHFGIKWRESSKTSLSEDLITIRPLMFLLTICWLTNIEWRIIRVHNSQLLTVRLCFDSEWANFTGLHISKNESDIVSLAISDKLKWPHRNKNWYKTILNSTKNKNNVYHKPNLNNNIKLSSVQDYIYRTKLFPEHLIGTKMLTKPPKQKS
jgi:hypothetical protein